MSTAVKTAARALAAFGPALIWFVGLGLLLGLIYQASLPEVAAIRRLEMAPLYTSAAKPSESSSWQEVQLPARSCRDQCGSDHTQYRTALFLAQAPSVDWAVYLPSFDANVVLFLNDHKLDQLVSAPGEVYRGRPRLVLLPASMLQEGQNTLVIHLLSELRQVGGLAPFYLAPAQQLLAPYRWRARLTEELILGFAWLQAASMLVALLVFILGRRERLFVWYLLASVFWLLHLSLQSAPGLMAGGWLRWNVVFVGIAGMLCFTPLFIFGILQTPTRRMIYACVGLFLGYCVFSVGAMQSEWLSPYWRLRLPNLVLTLMGAMSIPMMIAALVKTIWQRQGSRSSPWILAFAAMPGVFGIIDPLLNVIYPWLEFALLPLGGIGVSMALWLELGRRMMENQKRLANYTTELEQTVLARERTLQQSFARLRQADRERALAEERQRLLRDMHDGVGGQLASLVHLAGNPQVKREQVVDGLREGLADLRLILDSLAQDDADLMLALGRLRFRIEPMVEAAGMRLLWNIDPTLDLPECSPEAILHIYRFIQEAVHNAIRHAHASELQIRLCQAEQSVVLSVIDNGKGMSEQSNSGGFGLTNLRTRTARLGAQLRFDCASGGTQVHLALPLSTLTPKFGQGERAIGT